MREFKQMQACAIRAAEALVRSVEQQGGGENRYHPHLLARLVGTVTEILIKEGEALLKTDELEVRRAREACARACVCRV